MNVTVVVVLMFVNAPLYCLYWRWTFHNWEAFMESVRYWLTPDIISMFRGECEEDWLSEMRLFWWLFLCITTVAVEYAAIDYLFLE